MLCFVFVLGFFFFLVLQLRVEVSDFLGFFSPKKYDDGLNFTAVDAVEMITAPFV